VYFRAAKIKGSLLIAGVRLSNRHHDCAADHRFKFKKRSQDFIRVQNETLAVAVCVNNPNRSLLRING